MENHHFPVPMTIINGFLGAGKTTLVNHILLGNHGLKIAVLVNDFGAINIDTQLVVGIEGEMINLSNGCICCTIRGDLLNAIINLINQPTPPEYIIIETSGVSDPVAVASTFQMPEIRPFVRLDSILVVVDADQLLSLEEDNYALAIDQIGVADIIILNKVDLVTAEELEEIKSKVIHRLVPMARILETTYGQVPLELVLGVGDYTLERIWQRAEKDVHVHGIEESDHDHHEHEEGVHDAHDHHEHEEHSHEEHEHHHHEHTDHRLVFSTWSWTTDKPLSLKSLRRVFEELPITIYRAKGFIYLNDMPESRIVLQMVGKRASLTQTDDWDEEKPHTQIVMISSHGGMDAEALRAQFEACVVKDDKKLHRHCFAAK